MTERDWQSELRTRLEQSDLNIERTGDERWQVSRGGEPFAATTVIRPQKLVANVESVEDNASAHLASIVRGVVEVLYEPDASEAHEWNFERAAQSILPTLERPGFAIGASEAAGGDIFEESFEAGLVMTYRLLLDAGKRVLTSEQVTEWQATPDRVSSAARSLLFHRSRRASTRKLDGYDEIEELAMDDGHDAARLIVLEDLMFGEFDDSSRIAVPTPDDLLFVRRSDETSTRTLQEAVESRYDASSQPLTKTLFEFRRSKPKPVE